MDWVLALTLALYLAAVGFALARSRADGWPPRETVGRAVFLVGAAVALFLDDLLAALAVDAPVPAAAAELLGIGLLVVGGVVAWWRPDAEAAPE